MSKERSDPDLRLVKEAFKGYVPPFVCRGGHARNGVKPHYSPGDSSNEIPTSLDYHVEASFSQVQRRFIYQAVLLLDRLARGTQTDDTSYTTLVIENFQRQKTSPRYATALTQSIIELLAEFRAEHPNYTPALEALMAAGGALGIQHALNKEKHALASVLRGFLTQENKGIYRMPEEADFVGQGPRDMSGLYAEPLSDSYLYEVWCLGRQFAQTLIKESREAAFHLASSDISKYRINEEERLPDNLVAIILSLTGIRTTKL